MAELVQLREVSLRRGLQEVLRGVSFGLAAGDKVGLVGANGAGKTTLLALLAGRLRPTEGQISRAPGLRLASVTQDTADWRGTLWRVAEGGIEHVQRLEAALREAETRLDDDAQLARYAELTALFEEAGGYGAEATLKAHLSQLGFGEADYGRDVQTLSGGERARLGLARALAAHPDLLLLDEPSSFLDLPTKTWLAETLARAKSALLLASHDRALLDAVTRRTLHLQDGVVTGYRGGYSRFQAQAGHAAARRLRELRRAAHERQALQARIREQPTLSTRRALERRLERLPDAPHIPTRKTTTLALAAPPSRPNSLVVEARHLTLTQGARPPLRDVSLRLHAGDKVALVGPNGSGKTSLLRLLTGDLASEDPEAAVRFGPHVKLAVFDQHRRGLDDGVAVGEQLSRSVSEPRARSLLALVGLAEAASRPPETLSSGERARAGVALLLATEANLLLLDEPSEHLDVGTAEKLEAALQDTDATLLFVSHDAALIGAVATRVLGLDGGELREYRGGLAGFYAGTLRLEADLPEAPDAGPSEAHAENPPEDDPNAALEALEDETVATEALLADPLRLSARDRARLERRLADLTQRRSERYDARLPAPRPRYRVVEAGLMLTSDGPRNPAEPITLAAPHGVTLELYRDGPIGHLHLKVPQHAASRGAPQCLLPWAERALVRGAARLAFEVFEVQALQLQRPVEPGLTNPVPTDLASAGFTDAGAGWWVQDRDRYSLREGLLRPQAQPAKVGRSRRRRGSLGRRRGSRDGAG